MSVVLTNGTKVTMSDSVWLETIPEGKYTLGYLGHRLTMFKGAPKLEAYFQVIDDQYRGTKVIRYYNLKKTSGKTWWPKEGGHMTIELIRLFGERMKECRPDRIPLDSLFSQGPIVGEIRICNTTADGSIRPEGARPMAVGKLIRPA